MNAIYPVFPPLGADHDRDRSSPARSSEQFDINHDEQGLVLSGAAPSFYFEQLTQHAVGQSTPLPIVRNDSQTLPSSPQ